MLPHSLAPVEDVPQLRTLILRVPLGELIAMAEEALLGTGLLLVATGTTYGCIKVVLLDRVQERGCL